MTVCVIKLCIPSCPFLVVLFWNFILLDLLQSKQNNSHNFGVNLQGIMIDCPTTLDARIQRWFHQVERVITIWRENSLRNKISFPNIHFQSFGPDKHQIGYSAIKSKFAAKCGSLKFALLPALVPYLSVLAYDVAIVSNYYCSVPDCVPVCRVPLQNWWHNHLYNPSHKIQKCSVVHVNRVAISEYFFVFGNAQHFLKIEFDKFWTHTFSQIAKQRQFHRPDGGYN